MADAPFTRLLLASEHSPYDAGAERLAFELARHCGQPLNAVLPISYTAALDTEVPDLAQRADAEAARRREDLVAAAGRAGVELRLAVRHGAELYFEIVEQARERGADLLVIRRRGQRSVLADLLLGEMVHKVLAHAPCSVLVVPRAAAIWRQRVFAAVDPTGHPPELQLHPAVLGAAVARGWALPLTLAAVAASPSEAAAAAAALEQAAAAARAAGVEAETLALSGRVPEQLTAAARQCGADLVVVGRHGHTRQSRLARAWLGGMTQKVIGLAEGPVLVAIPPASTAP